MAFIERVISTRPYTCPREGRALTAGPRRGSYESTPARPTESFNNDPHLLTGFGNDRHLEEKSRFGPGLRSELTMKSVSGARTEPGLKQRVTSGSLSWKRLGSEVILQLSTRARFVFNIKITGLKTLEPVLCYFLRHCIKSVGHRCLDAHSQPHSSFQCVASLSGRNKISDGRVSRHQNLKRLIEEGIVGLREEEWSDGGGSGPSEFSLTGLEVLMLYKYI
ncbi:hypothetical protein EVAR_2279_1 [Eumeta japonica]|uniref:Uncharacterized protein n=1 Tax=Eumeta variegata TaxID=151549 RepID=A0A4C1SHY2_EUMVA|nr:hypothetical protein EVAR_2279_1 [Eumeta japonica]